MRVLALLFSLVLIIGILGGVVYYALPFLTSQPPSSSKKPKEILIGLDLSKSNPLITDTQFAGKVAAYIAPMVKDLKLRDEIKIRTFGTFDPREQPLHYDQVFTTDTAPEDVAATVQGIVAGVPTLIQRGTLKAQNSTNILGFLGNMAQIVDCKKHDVTIVLASDGIEQSQEAELTQETRTLPMPEKKMFAGCRELEILGLGVGAKSPSMVDHLREQWSAWAKAAGFKEFQGLNDW
jgi:nucleoid DNA-binding protein